PRPRAGPGRHAHRPLRQPHQRLVPGQLLLQPLVLLLQRMQFRLCVRLPAPRPRLAGQRQPGHAAVFELVVPRQRHPQDLGRLRRRRPTGADNLGRVTRTRTIPPLFGHDQPLPGEHARHSGGGFSPTHFSNSGGKHLRKRDTVDLQRVDGLVTIDSTSQPHSTVHRLLSRRATAPRETRMKVSSDPDPRLTVLIVDDNRDAADSMAILAELWGHNPRVAYDAPAALRLVAQEPPDVILADLGMPRLDGNALARALRKEPAGNYVTLVAVTGHTDPGLREQA